LHHIKFFRKLKENIIPVKSRKKGLKGEANKSPEQSLIFQLPKYMGNFRAAKIAT
jgi:uncharacterized protein YkvS